MYSMVSKHIICTSNGSSFQTFVFQEGDFWYENIVVSISIQVKKKKKKISCFQSSGHLRVLINAKTSQ